jgi:PAS domain S-box-containing protein
LFQQSLMTRLVGYFFILGLLVVILVGGTGFLYTRKTVETSLYGRLEAMASTKEEVLRRWVHEQRNELLLLASLPYVKEPAAVLSRLDVGKPAPAASALSPAEAYRSLSSLFTLYLSLQESFAELFFLSPVGGKILVSTRPQREGDYRVNDRYYLEGREGVFVQNVYPSPVTLAPAMTISAPVRDGDGGLLGVLAVNLNLEVMDSVVRDRSGLGNTGEAYLVDRFNIMVSGEEFGWSRYKRGYHSAGIESALSGQEGIGRYVNYRGVPVVGVYRFVEELDLALLIEISREEAFRAIRNSTLFVLLIGCGGVVLLGAGVLLLARQIARPVQALTGTARRIAEGDLDCRAPVTTRDEIGELGRSFNLMTERLESLYHELSKKEEQFRRFFEEDLTGDFLCTEDGTITACNPALAAMLGYDSPDQLLSRNLFSFFKDSQRAGRFRALLEHQGKLEYHEDQLHDRVGGTVHIIANATGRFDPQGKLEEIRGYLFDNTGLKELEEQLRQAQKIEAIGVLAGGIAHDFNNILTAINGYSELLVTHLQDDETMRSYAREIERAGNRAASLTRQLLAFSRKQLLRPQEVNVNRLVIDLERMLRRIIGEGVRLETELDPGLHPVVIDPGQLEQVIMNLAVNSRDAMPGGGTLRLVTSNVVLNEEFVSRHVGSRPGAYVLLEVGDTGVGMDQATRERIFEPFFTTKEVGKGTGLGLATVYGIVKQSGGYIGVESEPGKGSTFRIYLPLPAVSRVQAEQDRERAGGGRGNETVLLVEDETAVRSMLYSSLKGYGYRVIQAADGEEALRLFEQGTEPVHLLLTDVVMPRMNGEELAEEITRRDGRVKVLFMSGYTDREIHWRSAPPDDRSYLQKPFTPDQLVRRVRELFDAENDFG